MTEDTVVANKPPIERPMNKQEAIEYLRWIDSTMTEEIENENTHNER